MMRSDYWKGKRVFITGHTGFVGCWLALTLAEMGANVTGFSLPAEEGTLFSKVKEKLIITHIEDDLRDPNAVRKAIDDCCPQVVFHLAALAFVKKCFDDPKRTFDTNVLGTMNLLEAVRDCKDVETLVAASSDKVYLNRDEENVRFTEDDLLGGTDPYSASKTCEDILVRSYYDSYLKERQMSCVILRPSNILGGGDHNISRLIPGIFHAVSQGEIINIRNPNSVRPWQNIMDAIDAYLFTAEMADRGELSIFNIGPLEGDVRTAGEISSYILSLYGNEGEILLGGKSEDVREYAYLGLNCEKVFHELGWKPIRKLRDTLNGIFEFYSEDDGTNTYELCSKYIRKYYHDREMK